MKKVFNKSLVLLVCFSLALCTLAGGVSVLAGGVSVLAAAEESAKVEIISNNIEYGDKLKLAYAVYPEGLSSGDKVRVSLYDKDGVLIERINDHGEQTVRGLNCFTYVSTVGVPAQRISEEITAVAEVVRGGAVVASSAEQKYSVLEYLFERLTVNLEEGKVSKSQRELYISLLEYAKVAERVLSDKAESDRIDRYSYVRINDTVMGMYKIGSGITGIEHGLTLASGESVIWQINYYDDEGNYLDSVAVTDSELRSSGFTVNENNAVIEPRINAFGADEMLHQFATKGNPSSYSSSIRASIRIASPMKAGSKITMLWDNATYDFAILETNTPDNRYLGENGTPSSPVNGGYWTYDSGWQTGTTYTTKYDGYIIIQLAKGSNRGAAITDDEVLALTSGFKLEGQKLSAFADRGRLTQAEYENQPANYGSVPNPQSGNRGRVSFTVRMQAGTKIKFIGDSSKYDWAVVETTNTASTEYAYDTGWMNSTGATEYVTQFDGTYPVLTVRFVGNDTITDWKVIDSIHEMFTVEGKKYEGAKDTEIEVVDYDINSVNHRGYSALAPENTLAAYTLSAKMGFDAVECDVSFTKDGVAVLLHDSTIDRTSNGSGNISSLTLEEVRAYDFGSWKSYEYKGETIPTFDEFIALCKELGLHPYIELKSGDSLTAERAEALVNTVAKYGMLDNCTWISFNKDALMQIVEQDDGARIGYLHTDKAISAETVSIVNQLKSGKNEVFINAHYSFATAEAVVLLKSESIALEVWTVNKLDVLLSLDGYVSGVTSDFIVAGRELAK